MLKHFQLLLGVPFRPRRPDKPPNVYWQRCTSRRLFRVLILGVTLLVVFFCVCACGFSNDLPVAISPTPTPSPTVPTTCPSNFSAALPVSTPVATLTKENIQHTVETYSGFILSGSCDALLRAYDMLSREQQHMISFAQFITYSDKDMDYTLLRGCWRVLKEIAPVQEKDKRVWEMGLELSYVAYKGKKRLTFYWRFQLRIENRKLVISGIGLYGTGIGNAATQSC